MYSYHYGLSGKLHGCGNMGRCCCTFRFFLDGMAARILKAYSAIGKELDSLADVVSFGGVAPASAVFILLRDHSLFPGYLDTGSLFIPYLAFLIPVFFPHSGLPGSISMIEKLLHSWDSRHPLTGSSG